MILTRKIRAITRGKTRRRQKKKGPKLGLGAFYYRRNPHLVPPTPSELSEQMAKRNALMDAFALEVAWRGEGPSDPLDSPTWHEYYRRRDSEAAFIQRTVRPDALRITKLSSVKRDLV